MTPFTSAPREGKLSILCIGPHSDDIEIGAGGLLLSLIAAGRALDVTWCVASAPGIRNKEAYASALDFLAGCPSHEIELAAFDDTYFPAQTRAIKEWLGRVRNRLRPARYPQAIPGTSDPVRKGQETPA